MHLKGYIFAEKYLEDYGLPQSTFDHDQIASAWNMLRSIICRMT